MNHWSKAYPTAEIAAVGHAVDRMLDNHTFKWDLKYFYLAFSHIFTHTFARKGAPLTFSLFQSERAR